MNIIKSIRILCDFQSQKILKAIEQGASLAPFSIKALRKAQQFLTDLPLVSNDITDRDLEQPMAPIMMALLSIELTRRGERLVYTDPFVSDGDSLNVFYSIPYDQFLCARYWSLQDTNQETVSRMLDLAQGDTYVHNIRWRVACGLPLDREYLSSCIQVVFFYARHHRVSISSILDDDVKRGTIIYRSDMDPDYVCDILLCCLQEKLFLLSSPYGEPLIKELLNLEFIAADQWNETWNHPGIQKICDYWLRPTPAMTEIVDLVGFDYFRQFHGEIETTEIHF